MIELTEARIYFGFLMTAVLSIAVHSFVRDYKKHYKNQSIINWIITITLYLIPLLILLIFHLEIII